MKDKKSWWVRLQVKIGFWLIHRNHPNCLVILNNGPFFDWNDKTKVDTKT